MRPLCGKKHGGNRKSQGALARLCEFPGRFRFTALKGRNRVAPFRLGCSASLNRPQGALGFDPPLNPLGTPYPPPLKRAGVRPCTRGFREGARRVIGATAKPLYPIDGKAEGLDRRPQPSPKERVLDLKNRALEKDGGCVRRLSLYSAVCVSVAPTMACVHVWFSVTR